MRFWLHHYFTCDNSQRFCFFVRAYRVEWNYIGRQWPVCPINRGAFGVEHKRFVETPFSSECLHRTTASFSSSSSYPACREYVPLRREETWPEGLSTWAAVSVLAPIGLH